MIKTIRQHIKDIILNHPHTAQDISRLIGISEKAVYDHLEHIAKSSSKKETFVMVTANPAVLILKKERA